MIDSLGFLTFFMVDSLVSFPLVALKIGFEESKILRRPMRSKIRTGFCELIQRTGTAPVKVQTTTQMVYFEDSVTIVWVRRRTWPICHKRIA